jgi:hypothetical protein
MKNSNKYIVNKFNEFDHWWYAGTDAVEDMMQDCGVGRDELPPGLWEAAERGEVLHLQDTDEIISIPEDETEMQKTLVRALKRRKKWTYIDEHAVHLLDACETKRVRTLNGYGTTIILTVNQHAADALIEDGLWLGTETRIRVTPVGEPYTDREAYTIWYADGTTKEWGNNTCVSDKTEDVGKVLAAIRLNCAM